jgi:hypothetical protein
VVAGVLRFERYGYIGTSVALYLVAHLLEA